MGDSEGGTVARGEIENQRRGEEARHSARLLGGALSLREWHLGLLVSISLSMFPRP